LVGWLEFNVPFQHKYGYIRDEDYQVYDCSSVISVLLCWMFSFWW